MKKKGILALLAAGAMALSACGTDTSSADTTVMKIDEKEIKKSEYMVYLYTATKSFASIGGEEIWTMDFDGKTADELLEERTLNTLQSISAVEKYAKENNITLTAEQKTEAENAAKQFMQTTTEEDIKKMGVDEKSIIPFMESSYIYTLVNSSIAEEYKVDEKESAAYYEENKDNLKDYYTLFNINTIVLDDKQKTDEAIKKARAGEDFKKLFDEYDIDEDARKQENGNQMSVYKGQFTQSFATDTIPAVGEIPDPIEIEGIYFIIQITEEKIPTDDEVKAIAKQNFTANKQAEYSTQKIEEMTKLQKVEYVDDAFNSLEKFH